MPISQRELKDLVAAGVIDAGTAERIATHVTPAGAEAPRFDLTHTAYVEAALLRILPGAARRTLPRYRTA